APGAGPPEALPGGGQDASTATTGRRRRPPRLPDRTGEAGGAGGAPAGDAFSRGSTVRADARRGE
ncbi:hypothetical protein, partial [Streptomyces sp. URMC 129]|uniref:hypothetical protein n=1 Tax=Streptomyces sp. URMC 129 TaxID=3423407 RepID=UPI003F1DB1A6